MKYSELKRLLRAYGCSYVKSGGEHDRWYSPLTDSFFYLPRHDSKEVPKGMLKRITKEAGIE